MLPPSRDLVLVTGAGGFVGRRLLPALLSAGHLVRAFGRRPLPEGMRAAGLDERRGDLTDARSLADAVSGATAVFHLAALLGDAAGDAALHAVNVEGTRALARAARAAGVEIFIHVSSAGVYGDGAGEAPRSESAPLRPGTRYERSKLKAEVALRDELTDSKVAWAMLRPGGIYGADRPERLAFVRTVRRRHVWLHGPTRVLLHPTHVDDVIAALLRARTRAAEVGGTVFNIAGERPVDFRDWVDAIAARLGRRPLHIRLPRIRVINRSLDTTLARQRLGWEPISMARGLDELMGGEGARHDPISTVSSAI